MRRPRAAVRPTRARTVLAHLLYWLAVLAVSFAFVFLLLRFFEARDEPQLEQPAAVTGAQPTAMSNGAP